MNSEQIEAAAKTLAACMDYPWEHMPEQGRNNMRKHAKAVIEAALATHAGAAAAEPSDAVLKDWAERNVICGLSAGSDCRRLRLAYQDAISLAALTSAPAVPEAFTFGMEKVPATGKDSLTVVAHAATDWMRSITETELALIPNVGADGGRRDRCRQLYRIPLVRLTDAQSALLAQAEEKDAEIQRLRADAERYQWLRFADLDAMAAKFWPNGSVPEGEEFDAAIDSARALAKQEEKS